MIKKRFLKVGIILGFVIIFVLFYTFGVRDLLNIPTFHHYKDQLLGFVAVHSFAAVLLYMFVYMVTVLFSLPLGGVFTVMGGYIFGVLPTILYVDTAATVGGVGAFLLSRYVFGKDLAMRYPQYAKKFTKELKRHGWSYMLSLRLNISIPFFITNMVVGLTPLPLSTFIWTTFVGMIPGISLFAFAGSQLARVDRVSDIITPRIILVFGALALLPTISMALSRIRQQ